MSADFGNPGPEAIIVGLRREHLLDQGTHSPLVRAFVDPIHGVLGRPLVFDRAGCRTLADVIARVPLDNEAARPHLRVRMGGEIIDPSLYRRVLPKADTYLTVVLPLHGGDNNLLLTIASVALVAGAALVSGGALVPLLGAGFASGTLGANLLAAGLSLSASLLLQGLNAQRAGSTAETETVGSASAQNSFEPGAYLMRVMGARRVTPQMVMPPYTEIDGDDQLVTAVYGLAGPHQFTDIKVGTADIDGAADIEYELREGFASDADLTLVTDTRIEVPISLRLSQFRMESTSSGTSTVDTTISPYNPQWHRFETKRAPDKARLFLTFDAGLIFSGTSGPEPSNCAIRLRIRRRGTTTWYNLPEFIARGEKQNGALRLEIDFHWLATADMPGSVTAFSDSYGGWRRMFQSVQKTTAPTATYWTANAYFATNKVDYLSKQSLAIYLDTATFPQSDAYEIEVMRGYSASDNILTINSTVMHTINGNVTHYDFFTSVTVGSDEIIPPEPQLHVDGLTLAAIQSIWNEYPFDLTDQPTMLLAIRARNRNLQNVSGLAEGYCPDWNGTTWVDDQLTSNPASWYRETLRGELNAEPVPDSLIDGANLVDWHEWNESQGHELSLVVKGQPVDEVLSTIAQAGFARPLYGVQHGVIPDRPREQVGLVTMRNAAGFSFEKPFGRMPHALKVQLTDEDDDYSVRELIVYADGYAATAGGGLLEATRFESVTYPGITSEALAEKRAVRDMRFGRYRSRLISFTQDIEHLEFNIGDRIGLETDILGQIGGRGRVKSVLSSSGLVTGLLLDEERNFDKADADGDDRGVQMRLADGTLLNKQVTGDDSNLNQVLFTTPFAMPTDGAGDLIGPGTLVATGALNHETLPVILWEMTPGPDLTCSVVAIPYAEEEVYGLFRLFAKAGAFSLAGQDAILLEAVALIADTGVFAHSGQTAATQYRLAAGRGTFTESGQAATFVPATFQAYLGKGDNTTAPSTSRTMSFAGPARTGRMGVAIVSRGVGSGDSPDTVSLNGVSFTKQAFVNNGDLHASIWTSNANVTTTGTDSVIAVWPGLQEWSRAYAYKLDNLQSQTASATATAVGGGTKNISVNVPLYGVAIAVEADLDVGGHTWTGATENHDDVISADSSTSGSVNVPAGATPQSITVTAGSTAVAVAASFR